MTLTSIETIALIFSILCLFKVAIVLVSRKFWFKYVTKNVIKARMITTAVLFALSIVVFYFLILGLDLVTLFAVMSFSCLLIAAGFSMYFHEMINLGKGIVHDKLTIWIVIYSLIWAVLSVIVLIKIFW